MRIVAIACLLASGAAFAQKDTAIAIPFVGVHFGGQLPQGDLAGRFGPNLEAGGTFGIKTARNWLFGIESNYFFGRNIKEQVLSNLTNADGFVVDNEGYPADLRLTERGVGVHIYFGKLFAVTNRNSGPFITMGAGYLQHKVHVYDAQHRVASVNGDLVRGYDRLTGGFSLSCFAGYMFFGNQRLINFYAGLQVYEAFTKSYRQVNYNTGLRDTKRRIDGLTGLRVGWMLPLYKKRPDDYYFY